MPADLRPLVTAKTIGNSKSMINHFPWQRSRLKAKIPLTKTKITIIIQKITITKITTTIIYSLGTIITPTTPTAKTITTTTTTITITKQEPPHLWP